MKTPRKTITTQNISRMLNMKPISIMTIGGSDPSGGAGIQADLKAFNLLGLHGTTTLTSITVQNTQRVSSVEPLPISLIEQQIDELMNDFSITFIKTGLLCDQQTITLITKKAKRYGWSVIVDPVLGSTTGDSLAATNTISTFKNNLLPQCFCVTPNISEAESLTNTTIQTTEDMKHAARQLNRSGAKHVIIKGGHLQGKNATDIYYDGSHYYDCSLPLIPNKKAHGSGCTLSALYTGFLALEKQSIDAFYHAKYLLWYMIKTGFFPGKGVDILNTSPSVIQQSPIPFPSKNHFTIWHTLHQHLQPIIEILPKDLVPEVGINIGYALSNAQSKEEICALSGRIISTSTGVSSCGPLCFGGSQHIASIILACMKYDTDLRSAMNIKYSEKNLSCCRREGLEIASFDRKDEPVTVDSTMEWGTTQALKKHHARPQLIYDTGSIGKEPMIRIIGKHPKELYKTLCRIINHV